MNEKGRQRGISEKKEKTRESAAKKKTEKERGAEGREQKRESMMFGKTVRRASRVQTFKEMQRLTNLPALRPQPTKANLCSSR